MRVARSEQCVRGWPNARRANARLLSASDSPSNRGFVLFRLEDETLAVASPAGITCTNVASSVPSAGAGATCASADLRLSEPIPRLSNRGSWAARKREQGTNMTMWTWSCPSFAVCQIRNQPERLYLRHRDSSEMVVFVVLWAWRVLESVEKANYDVRPRHLRIHPCVRLQVTEFLCACSRMCRFEVGLLLSTSRGSLKHSSGTEAVFRQIKLSLASSFSRTAPNCGT